VEEKMRILKMLEEGTITAEEASDLIEALQSTDTQTTLMAEKPYNKRMLRILVDNESNGDKVTVQFPVGAVKKILKVTGKLPLPEEQMQDFDLAELMEAINECLDEELDGDIVNVTSSAENTTIRICIE
jgi:2,3-bisphosphoglycerate-independent phosphoglycerate mutase